MIPPLVFSILVFRICQLNAPPLLFYFVSQSSRYLVQTTNCGLRYTRAILAHPPAIISCFVQIFSSTPCTQTPSIFVLLTHSAVRDRLTVWPYRTFGRHNPITGGCMLFVHVWPCLGYFSQIPFRPAIPAAEVRSVHSTSHYGVQTKRPVFVVGLTTFLKRPRQIHTSTDIRHRGGYLYGESDHHWINSWLL